MVTESIFPRIDPMHPLTRAARDVNAHAEDHGLAETLRWLDIDVGEGELAYLGEQRALRAVAASILGRVDLDDMTALAITQTPLWKDMRMLLIGCYMDGIAIGWRGRDLRANGEE